MALILVITVLGAFAHRIPLGPDRAGYRASIWLTPVVAFGLAVVLERVGRIATRRVRGRAVFDGLLFALACLLLLTPLGVARTYENGARAATREAMAGAGPNDAVLVTRPTIFSFALYADTRVKLQPDAQLTQGFMPEFADRRVHPIDWLSPEQRQVLRDAVAKVDRVYVVDSQVDPRAYRSYRIDLALSLRANGFEPAGRRDLNGSTINVWRRVSPGT
jgi:hypothetical protein